MNKLFGIQLIVVFILSMSYVGNAYKFIQCDFESPYKEEFIHGIGVVSPLSIITIWYNKED